MKVLYVSKALLVAAYRDKLRELGLRVELSAVMPERWGSAEPEPSPDGVPEPSRVRAWLHGRNHLHVYPGASRWLAAASPDLVHVDEEPYSLVTLQLGLACRRFGIPFVFFTWQNLDKRLPPPFGALRSWVYRSAAAGLAGKAGAERVLRASGFQGRAAVIPQFGVDPDAFRRDELARGEVRVREGIDEAAFVVGYAGRLVPEKGVDVLLEAVRRLEGATLVVIGEGPEESRLRQLAARAGTDDRVRFVGHRPSLEMPGWLSAMDVLVLPSVGSPTWTEQFGRVLVEAMACGTPVVGTRCGEMPDVIGDAGVVVEAGDADALAAALERLRSDPPLRAVLADAGRARVLERFTNERIAGDTVEVYESVLGSRPAERAG